VLITRTPLRISLGGGGTDLPSFYAHHGGGFLVTAAISKYVYIAVHENFVDRYLLKYSRIEDVADLDAIEHPLLREALRLTGTPPRVEVTSIADIPAGTGLGSSGTFGVGLLKALHAYGHRHVSNAEIAEQACRIEIDILGEPVGKQDQYAAAIGGLIAMAIAPDGSVTATPLPLTASVREEFTDHLMLFYTGVQRSASAELRELAATARPGASGEAMARNLSYVREAGRAAAAALTAGDLDRFGGMLTEQWQLKYDRAPSAVHDQVDAWIRAGIAAGAHGGKLVGAGGGGFLLFYAHSKPALRAAMREQGLPEVPFTFDYLGSTVLT